MSKTFYHIDSLRYDPKVHKVKIGTYEFKVVEVNWLPSNAFAFAVTPKKG